MKLKIHILILILFLSVNLGAQEKYRITSNYKDISFIDFVTRVKSMLPVKFFYRDDWVWTVFCKELLSIIILMILEIL